MKDVFLFISELLVVGLLSILLTFSPASNFAHGQSQNITDSNTTMTKEITHSVENNTALLLIGNQTSMIVIGNGTDLANKSSLADLKIGALLGPALERTTIPCKTDGGIECPAPPRSLCERTPWHSLCPIKDPCPQDPSGLSCPSPRPEP
jgi:hypothetical protein